MQRKNNFKEINFNFSERKRIRFFLILFQIVNKKSPRICKLFDTRKIRFFFVSKKIAIIRMHYYKNYAYS